MIKNLVLKNRSYRRYEENFSVSMETLRELVELGRISSSGANKQPLKYVLSCRSETNARIFDQLSWAGALKDWPGPEKGERPAAYIVILGDSAIGKAGIDHGIAATNILLGAVEKGLGGCMLGTIKRDSLREHLDIDERFEILLVLAIGKPKEVVQLETAENGAATTYYRDPKQIHHVPKRKLEDVIIGQFA